MLDFHAGYLLGTEIYWYCTFFAIEVISQGKKFTRWDYYLNLLKKINYNIFWLHLWQYIVPAELTKPQL
jgi:hypothetical protein